MRRLLTAARAALALLLSATTGACTGSQTQVVQVASPPAAAPAAPQVVRHLTIPVRNVGALSGKRQQLDFYASLDDDCASLGAPAISIVRPPTHGHAEAIPAQGYPGYRADNPHAHCNARRVPGTRLVYTSDPGYTGPDPFAVSVLFPSGNRLSLVYAMVVQ